MYIPSFQFSVAKVKLAYKYCRLSTLLSTTFLVQLSFLLCANYFKEYLNF